MLIHRLGREECGELLTKLGSGRLGCARDNQPYIVPIYFAYEPDRLYGFATFGRKIDWMRTNPLVCVQADEVRGPNNWASVLVMGQYEELPDTPEYREDRKQAQALLEKRSLWWQAGFAASQARLEYKPPQPVFYCIHIHEMTGFQASPDPVEAAISKASVIPGVL